MQRTLKVILIVSMLLVLLGGCSKSHEADLAQARADAEAARAEAAKARAEAEAARAEAKDALDRLAKAATSAKLPAQAKEPGTAPPRDPKPPDKPATIKLENRIWPIRLYHEDLTKTEKHLADNKGIGGVASVDSIVAAAKLGDEVAAAQGADQLLLKQRFDYLIMGIKLEYGPSVEIKDLSKPMVDALTRKDFDEFNRLANYVNAQRLWCNGFELGIDVNELVKMAKLMASEVKAAKSAADQFMPIEKMQRILDDAMKKTK